MSDLSFSSVDLAVAGIVLVSAGYAVYRGFIAETLTIVAWAAAAFATLYFSGAVEHALEGHISPAWLTALIAYAGVFVAVFIPLSFISFRIAQSVRGSQVGTLDRSLGLAFGVVRGLAIVGFAYFVFSSFVPVKTQPQWIAQARTLPLIQRSTEVLLSLVPDRGTPDVVVEKPDARQAKAEPAEKTNVPPAAPALALPHSGHAEREARRIARKPSEKAYGAKERRALDTLIEATGSDGSAKP